MGQCYFVEADLKFGDDGGRRFCSSVKAALESSVPLHRKDDFSTPFGSFLAVCPGAEDAGDSRYSAAFDGTYSWICVMEDVFAGSLCFCEDGSVVKIYPDRDVLVIRKDNGKVSCEWEDYYEWAEE